MPSNSSYVNGWEIEENTKVTVITHLYVDLLEDGFKHGDSQPWGQGHTQALGEKRSGSTEGILGILAQPSRHKPKTGLFSYSGNHNIQVWGEVLTVRNMVPFLKLIRSLQLLPVWL